MQGWVINHPFLKEYRGKRRITLETAGEREYMWGSLPVHKNKPPSLYIETSHLLWWLKSNSLFLCSCWLFKVTVHSAICPGRLSCREDTAVHHINTHTSLLPVALSLNAQEYNTVTFPFTFHWLNQVKTTPILKGGREGSLFLCTDGEENTYPWTMHYLWKRCMLIIEYTYLLIFKAKYSDIYYTP